MRKLRMFRCFILVIERTKGYVPHMKRQAVLRNFWKMRIPCLFYKGGVLALKILALN